MNKLIKLRSLSLEDYRFLAGAFVLLPLIALGLRVCGFGKVQSVLGRFAQVRKNRMTDGADLLKARQSARIVGVAARHGLFQPNCLPRSLTLWTLLRRLGIESSLRIGVRKGEAGIEAHAWVEYDGMPLNDGDDDVHNRFAAFEQGVSGFGVESR